MKVFGYPKFDENGMQVLTTYDNEYSHQMMDIRVYRMKAGETKTVSVTDEEAAILLLSGDVEMTWKDHREEAKRKDVFTDGPYLLHIYAKDCAEVTALTDSEILIQKTNNENECDAEWYRPEDAPWGWSCVGMLGNNARRRVNTIFDYDIAPKSNMVIGEVLNAPGNWSGYIPHRHPQPETYYFKFDHPEGFGASFVGDQVFKSTDGSFSAIPGGETHPQSAAPGYVMYTCWMIRHLPNDPWVRAKCEEPEEFLWLHDYKEEN